MVNEVVVDASTIQRPEVTTSKEVEMKAVLTTLKRQETSFTKIRVLMDAKKVVQDLKENYDRSITSIILDNKALAYLFCNINFDYIPKSINGDAHMLTKFCYSTRIGSPNPLGQQLSVVCNLPSFYFFVFLPFFF